MRQLDTSNGAVDTIISLSAELEADLSELEGFVCLNRR